MGRRRRRVVRIIKKKLPTVFVCPRCGEEAVRVSIAKDTGKAVVLCALCSLKDEFQAHPAAQMIDVYSYFTDRFYGVKDPRAIIPREREAPVRIADEEPEKEPAVSETAIVEAPEQSLMSVENKAEPITLSDEPRPPVQPVEEPQAAQEELIDESAEKAEAAEGAETESQEEAEPFADILQSKDKKRYSPNPLPQQSSEQPTES